MAGKFDDNQIDSRYEQGHGQYLADREAAYANSGVDKTEAKNPKAMEENPTNSGWDTDVSAQGPRKAGTMRSKGKAILKAVMTKRGAGVLGLVGGGSVIVGLLISFFGSSTMVINLMEQIGFKNDTASSAMEQRILKVFGYASKENDDPACNKKGIRCRSGRISNAGLKTLERKGVVAYFNDDGSEKYDGTKKGYPKTNPKGYIFDLGDGSEPRNVPRSELTSFLSDKKNAKYSARVLGRVGAFNMRMNAWTGKHISTKFYDKFGLKRNGGIFDGENKKMTADERKAAMKERIKSSVPTAEEMGSAKETIREKVNSQTKKAAKGGGAYVAAVASCIGVKAPSYIAAGIAAVQLAQILPMFMDLVNSPGAKLKSNAVETDNPTTPEDLDAAGSALTERTARESDGKMTSALDSAILLAAMGVNTSKAPLSQKFTPGYAAFTSSIVSGSEKAADATEGACSVIMSPQAMYTAAAVDAAATVATSATIVGGLIKVAVTLTIGAIATIAADQLITYLAENALTEFAKNDAIPQAEGEELGDVLGTGAAAFYSSGAMARGVPGLTESQAVAFEQLNKENEDQQRLYDIASLSPFDTSSRYTFMGSIMNNIRVASIANGGFNATSLFSSLFTAPFATQKAQAASMTASYCSYAKDFDLDSGDPNTTPALNMAGLPCTGLSPTQASMTTDEAIELMFSEGWLDDTKEMNDSDSLEDLVKNGYIVADTPLTDYIEQCTDASTGDYIFNSAGCTISTTADAASGQYDNSLEVGEASQTMKLVNNPRSLAAIPVFMLDFQAIQSINGEDVGGAEATTQAGGGVTGDAKQLAQTIVQSGQVTSWDGDNGAGGKTIMEQLQGMADGTATPECQIDIQVLRVLAGLVSNGHTIQLTDLNRTCARSTLAYSEGGHWDAPSRAIDFGLVDGSNPMSNSAIINEALSYIEPGYVAWVGQVQCSGSRGLVAPSGVTIQEFNDGCHHLHIGIKAG